MRIPVTPLHLTLSDLEWLCLRSVRFCVVNIVGSILIWILHEGAWGQPGFSAAPVAFLVPMSNQSMDGWSIYSQTLAYNFNVYALMGERTIGWAINPRNTGNIKLAVAYIIGQILEDTLSSTLPGKINRSASRKTHPSIIRSFGCKMELGT